MLSGARRPVVRGSCCADDAASRDSAQIARLETASLVGFGGSLLVVVLDGLVVV